MIDWEHSDWSYLLGVVHGDGCVVSRGTVSIAVGYSDSSYAALLVRLWRSLGYRPKVYRSRGSLRGDVHSRALRNEFAKFKNQGKWSWPKALSVGSYLAGVFDTDGCVSSPQSKSITITLKRSGNLIEIARMLNNAGMRHVKVSFTKSKFHGRDYLTETIKLSGMDRIVSFDDLACLRHPRKRKRLREMRRHVDELLAHVPLWARVAEWLKKEPRTCDEIAKQFSLTWDQAQSALFQIKRKAKIEIIPPPRPLTRYRVPSE